MTSHDLEGIALALVADGKGILAADETVPTLTRRFDALGIELTEQSRRAYREMLFASPAPQSSSAVPLCMTKLSARRAPAARHLPRCLRVRASFLASRSTLAQNLSPAHLTSGSPKASTVCATASQSTAPWVPASRNGGRSSM